MDTAAQRFAEFSSSLTIDQVPEEVLESEKLHILDTLGCGLAAEALEAAPAARRAMTETVVSGPATASMASPVTPSTTTTPIRERSPT
jgi:2-methylcitrate dehydratase PrpD